jgi:hypothetical protein
MTEIIAPIFAAWENPPLTVSDAHTRATMPERQLALIGPSATAEAGHLPVRGDLAHIKLAGRYFVPHYAVPMPFAVKNGGAVLRPAASLEADALATLPAGASFDVLDIAGGWAWGQYGEDGPVGYVPLAELETANG